MSLRSLNNPSDAKTIMSVLPFVLTPFTALYDMTIADGGTDGTERFYTEASKMVQGAFPAVLMLPGQLVTTIAGGHSYEGTAQIKVRYYDRWDTQQSLTIADVWQASYDDLARMAANLEDNNSLAYLGHIHAVSIPQMSISDTPETDELLGTALVYRELVLSVQILPYLHG